MPYRIDDLKKRKSVKVGISGADLADSVLAHENGRMCVMEYITGEVR